MATDAPQASGSPDSRSPLTEAMPNSVAGRYRIERLLGKGASVASTLHSTSTPASTSP